MTNRIEPREVVVAAGTLITAPQITSVSFEQGVVTRLEIRIPPGPSGLMGFRIGYSGQSVIPYTGSLWIVGDNEKLDWDLDRFPDRGDWEVHAYNDDIYPHTIYLRFHVSDRDRSIVPTIQPLDIFEIAPAED